MSKFTNTIDGVAASSAARVILRGSKLGQGYRVSSRICPSYLLMIAIVIIDYFCTEWQYMNGVEMGKKQVWDAGGKKEGEGAA